MTRSGKLSDLLGSIDVMQFPVLQHPAGKRRVFSWFVMALMSAPLENEAIAPPPGGQNSSVVDTVRPAGSGNTTLARALCADGRAVGFTLDEWMIRLYPRLSFDTAGYGRRAEIVKDLIWSRYRSRPDRRLSRPRRREGCG